MEEPGDIISALQSLHLQELPSFLIDNVRDGVDASDPDFVVSLESDYLSEDNLIDALGALRDCLHRLRPAGSRNSGDASISSPTSGLWSLLSSSSVAVQIFQKESDCSNARSKQSHSSVTHSLLALLSHLLVTRCDAPSDYDEEAIISKQKVLQMQAAVVYLLCLQVPGSSAYGIFKPNLFRQLLATLTMWTRDVMEIPHFFSSSPSAEEGTRLKKRRPLKGAGARKRKRTQESDDSEEDEDADGEESNTRPDSTEDGQVLNNTSDENASRNESYFSLGVESYQELLNVFTDMSMPTTFRQDDIKNTVLETILRGAVASECLTPPCGKLKETFSRIVISLLGKESFKIPRSVPASHSANSLIAQFDREESDDEETAASEDLKTTVDAVPQGLISFETLSTAVLPIYLFNPMQYYLGGDSRAVSAKCKLQCHKMVEHWLCLMLGAVETSPASERSGASSELDSTTSEGDIGVATRNDQRRKSTSSLMSLPLPATASPASELLSKTLSLTSSQRAPAVLQGLMKMLQLACVRAPDRSEVRSNITASIARLVSQSEMPQNQKEMFCSKFLAQLSRSNKITFRKFAVELAGKLLSQSEMWATTMSQPSEEIPERKMSLMLILMDRASDKAPPVRARSLQAICSVLEAAFPGLVALSGLSSLWEANTKKVQQLVDWPLLKSMKKFLQLEVHSSAQRLWNSLLTLSKRRLQDSKPAVRRHSLTVINALAIIFLAERTFGLDTVQSSTLEGTAAQSSNSNADLAPWVSISTAVQERCSDWSVSTRKTASTVMTTLLCLVTSSENLQWQWLNSVPSLINDTESTAQSRIVDIFSSLILARIVNWQKQEQNINSSDGSGGEIKVPSEVLLAWDLLGKAAGGRRIEIVNAFQSTSGNGAESACLGAGRALQKALSLTISAQKLSLLSITDALSRGIHVGLQLSPDLSLGATETSMSEAQKKGNSMRKGGWLLLEEMANKGNFKQATSAEETQVLLLQFVLQSWDRLSSLLEPSDADVDLTTASSRTPRALIEDGSLSIEAIRVLKVLQSLSAVIPAATATELAEELLELLSGFCAPPSWISPLISALSALCFVKAPSVAEAKVINHAWGTQLISLSSQILQDLVLGKHGHGAITTAHVNGRESSWWSSLDANRLERALFTIGELSLMGVEAEAKENVQSTDNLLATGTQLNISERLIVLVQSLLAPTLPLKTRDGLSSTTQGVKNSPLASTGLNGGSPANSPDKEAESVSEAHEDGYRIPDRVRAHAFLALGKLCLRDQGLAKQSLPVFLREFQSSTLPAIRSNVLLVLSDLCRRYTALVDPYVVVMAKGVMDGNAIVRRHTLLLLSQLLLQDYIRIKSSAVQSSSTVTVVSSGSQLSQSEESSDNRAASGGSSEKKKHKANHAAPSRDLHSSVKLNNGSGRGAIFFYLLRACGDPNIEVRSLAHALLTGPLAQKFPAMFIQHFVPALFVLNDYHQHPIYNQGDGQTSIESSLADGESKGTFAGTTKSLSHKISINRGLGLGVVGKDDNSREQRMNIYRMMLETMQPEDKLQVLMSLLTEVLNGVLHNSLRLSSPTTHGSFLDDERGTEAILRDTFMILNSPEIDLGRGTKSKEDEDEDDLEVAESKKMAARLNAAKSKLFSQISRKNLVENILPTLIGLKKKLENNHSPIVKDLMQYLVFVHCTYKEEVKEVLAADQQLSREVEYDIKQYEKQKEREQQEKAMAREQERQVREAQEDRRLSTNHGPVLSPGFRSPLSSARPGKAMPAGVKTPSMFVESLARNDRQRRHSGGSSLRRHSLGPGSFAAGGSLATFISSPPPTATALAPPKTTIAHRRRSGFMSPNTVRRGQAGLSGGSPAMALGTPRLRATGSAVKRQNRTPREAVQAMLSPGGGPHNGGSLRTTSLPSMSAEGPEKRKSGGNPMLVTLPSPAKLSEKSTKQWKVHAVDTRLGDDENSDKSNKGLAEVAH